MNMITFRFRWKPTAVLLVVAVALGAGCFFLRDGLTIPGVGREAQAQGAAGGLSTNEGRRQYLIALGWEVGEEPEEIREVVIPQEFDDTYQQYNQLQKEQGFDLERYKGQRAKVYTYRVLNYPDHPDNILAHLVICDWKVVGGDVCSAQLDGFMQGLEQPRFSQDDGGLEEEPASSQEPAASSQAAA